MLAMLGLRAFSLAARRGGEGVWCDADGVFVGGVPLLHSPRAEQQYWTARPAAEINEELTARYRLPIDIASRAGALALIAAALNRGDLAIAAIATVQMQFPDPPPLGKTGESQDEIVCRAREFGRSGFLKFFWNPAQHPRAGVPPNPGWFTLVGDKPEHLEVVPGITVVNPADKPWEPPPAEGEEEENAPRGIAELPLPGGSPGASSPDAAPKPFSPLDSQPSLPFPGGLPPQLSPYMPGGKTSGVFYPPGGSPVPLQSGYDGPAEQMPPGSPGFNGLTLSHVEGHAAALMREEGIMEGTLYINNPKVCGSCTRLLPTMLPSGAILNVVLPDSTVIQFMGTGP